MLNEHNEWRLAPAYDLTFTHGPGGEHTMTVAGEGRTPERTHILRIADGAGISQKQALEIMDEVASAVAKWQRFAEEACVSNKMAMKISSNHRGATP